MNKKISCYLELYQKKISTGLSKVNKKNLFLASDLIEKAIKRKYNIYICGNGGSHAIANHYICDFFKSLSQGTNLKPRVKSLCSNTELISAIANDINFDEIFSYQLKRCLKKTDILILISSSGKSKNIKLALDYSNKIGAKSIGFTGFDGGYLKKKCSISLHCETHNYGASEDISQILMHVIMHHIKIKNFKKKNQKIVL